MVAHAPTVALILSRFLLCEDELGNVMTVRSIDEIERHGGYDEKYSANENNRKQRQSENQEQPSHRQSAVYETAKPGRDFDAEL